MEHTNHEVEIIVNGRPRTVHQHELTFEQVVKLAFGEVNENPNIEYTVTYAWGPTEEGTMVRGGRPVAPREGMIFNVTKSDKS